MFTVRSVSHRLQLGFGSLLLVLGVVAADAWYSGRAILDHVASFQTVADKTASIVVLEGNIGDLEVALISEMSAANHAADDVVDQFDNVFAAIDEAKR